LKLLVKERPFRAVKRSFRIMRFSAGEDERRSAEEIRTFFVTSVALARKRSGVPISQMLLLVLRLKSGLLRP